MNRLALSIYAAVLCFAGTALAAGPTTHTRTLNISGTAMPAVPADVDSGNGSACNFDP